MESLRPEGGEVEGSAPTIETDRLSTWMLAGSLVMTMDEGRRP